MIRATAALHGHKKLATLILAFVLLAGFSQYAFAQLRIVGAIAGSIHDPTGAVIPGATVVLKDEGTGITREMKATAVGTFIFPDLAHGLYEVTVTASGFQQMVIGHIQVIASQTTDVPVEMKIGQTTESVVVEGVAPLLETTSNLTNTTQTTKVINELPTGSRTPGLDFAQLVPGYTSARINNAAGGAMNVTLDGINNASNGWKSGGTVWYNTVPIRLGALEEVTVESGGLGADSGGQSGVNVKLITKRGTNQYHGQGFYQPTSEQFNANSWSNNAQGIPRTKSRTHNFGGNIGGPLVPFGYLKDKFFFFFNYEYVWTPSVSQVTTTILTDDAQNGIWKYIKAGTTNQVLSVNVLQLAGQFNAPTKLDPIAQSYQEMTKKIKQYARQVDTTDLNRTSWLWNRPNPQYQYYPTTRADYYVTPQQQISFTWNYRHSWQPGTKRFPWEDSKWTGPFRLGYFVWAGALQSSFGAHTFNEFRYGTQHSGDTNASATANYGTYNVYNNVPLRISSNSGNLPFGTLAPYIDQQNTTGRHYITTIYDTVTRIQGQHTVRAGFTFRRTDWRDVSERFPYPTYSLGTPSGDPIPSTLFNTATVPSISDTSLLPGTPATLYNELVGRVASAAYSVVVDPEKQQFGGFIFTNWARSYMGGPWVQDSWRVNRALTLNFGLRWEIQGDIHDVQGISATPTMADIYGPSTALFTPGALSGNNDPTAKTGIRAYKADKLNFAPNFGFAWNPRLERGLLGKFVGRSGTVIRGSYGITYYDEGTLMYSGYYGCGPGLGIGCNAGKQASQTLQAGTSSALPQFTTLSDLVAKPLTQAAFTSLPAYNPVLHQNTQTFSTSFAGMKPTLVAPYMIQWNFGVQRQLTRDLVLEVKYVGNQTHRQWRTYDLNEVNIFENGFLDEFKHAKANLDINIANGKTGFANNGLPGQYNLPIFAAAFGPRGTVPAIASGSGYTSTTFINYLNNGAVGSFASAMTGQNYFCRMMGNSFAPCLRAGIAPTGTSYDAPGAGYPINFFTLNPYTTTMNFVDDAGWADYNGLQTQLRKAFSRGLTFTFNYTWSHGMSNTGADGPMMQENWSTLRNTSLDRRPSLFDRRHTISSFATYDLPVGTGRLLDLGNRWLNTLAGGWTVSSIFTFSTGAPARLGGNYNTFNTFAPQGVVLAPGVTLEQISAMFHGQPLQKINQKENSDGRLNRASVTDRDRLAVPLDLIGPDGRANPKYLTWNTTPGTIGQILYIYGKNSFSWNAAMTKTFAITERIKFQLYADAQNVLNHPSWGMGNLNLYSTSFGTVGAPSGNRTMTFRGQVSF
jgi:hypothetical protein